MPRWPPKLRQVPRRWPAHKPEATPLVAGLEGGGGAAPQDPEAQGLFVSSQTALFLC